MRILICNGAHVGDVILATALLPALRSAYPEAEIGFLVGSLSACVVNDHQLVNYVHIYEHVALNRALLPKREKRRREKATKKKVLKELALIRYDVAFDLFSHAHKHVGALLLRAAIPERVGFWSCRAPFYYNKLLYWDWRSHHTVENQRHWLKEWGIGKEHLKAATPLLIYHTQERVENLPEKYIALHMGTGAPQRCWNLTAWRTLLALLSPLNIPLLLLGKGAREERVINYVIKDFEKSPKLLNYCNRLSWKQLITVIKQAQLFIGLESMGGHIAAASDTPSLLLYGGSASIELWRPWSAKAHLVTPSKSFWSTRNQLVKGHVIDSIDPLYLFKKIEGKLNSKA